MACFPFLHALLDRRTFMEVVGQFVLRVISAARERADESAVPVAIYAGPDPEDLPPELDVLDVYAGPDLEPVETEEQSAPVAIYAAPDMMGSPVSPTRSTAANPYPSNFQW